MLLIHCPYCEEERPELEFHYAGEAHLIRPAGDQPISDADFASYLFRRENAKGVALERWRHLHGCGRFFNAMRNTHTDKFVKTYKSGEPRPNLMDEAETAQ